jgi:hypothetical protein
MLTCVPDKATDAIDNRSSITDDYDDFGMPSSLSPFLSRSQTENVALKSRDSAIKAHDFIHRLKALYFEISRFQFA